MTGAWTLHRYLCPHVEGRLGDSLDGEGRVAGWEGLCRHVRDEVFGRMGLDDAEIVALLCGGHVYGRCHPTASGYAGPWVEHPTAFSNEYATDMIEDDWTLVDHTSTWLDAQAKPPRDRSARPLHDRHAATCRRRVAAA